MGAPSSTAAAGGQPLTDRRVLDAIVAAAPGAVSLRAIDRYAMAHDASHYLRVPQAIVTPQTAEQVSALLVAARQVGMPLTFRSGGTSLSGQAGSDHLLVDTRRHFASIAVHGFGSRVTVGPGATVRAVNARLAPFGRKLGPDPASEIACTMGGVIANNSSGMACGTQLNTYQTLESAVLVLPSGTVVDTAHTDADEMLAHREPELHQGLRSLRDRVRSNPASVATIERLFAMKNTMGYSLNAFLDHDRAIDILLHLVVGSEGTLAFVAEATLRTVALHQHCSTGLLLFPDLHRATDVLPTLTATGLATIELMDATSLRIAQRDPGADPAIRDLDIDRHAGLLVEFQAESTEALDVAVERSAATVAELPLSQPAAMHRAPRARAALWRIRKGLYASVAGNRPPGTTALLEDIAVPVPRLADTCASLTALFATHGYGSSVIFGHAKDGNIHFLLNESFGDPAGTARYEAFTEDMVELVLSHGGTLKAEHGTGRIMAPYVQRQYGAELFDVMTRLKTLCDPAGVLNPGAILAVTSTAHVSDLKTALPVEEEVDRCVECGYCEPVCPSRNLTLTPRQRIVLRRELARAEHTGDLALARELREDYTYAGVETCAADGMCQTACPVLIDTGQLVKRLRAEGGRPVERKLWDVAAKRWATVTHAASIGMSTARRLPSALVTGTTDALRAAGGQDSIPRWSDDLPGGGSPRVAVHSAQAEAVYFPSCMNTIFGADHDSVGVGVALQAMCDRAALRLRTPAAMPTLCCGTPWKSKGHLDGHRHMATRVLLQVWAASEAGRLPVVVDATSCTEGLSEMAANAGGRYAKLLIVDSLAFARNHLLDRLPEPRSLGSLTVHPTCSSTRLDLNADLLALAEAVAVEVHVPTDWGCCAFAGDRGLLHPELTASACQPESAQVRQRVTDGYVSTNRTCELGMTRSTGRPYRHILEVLDAQTR